MLTDNSFHWVDYVVFSLMLVLSVSIGVYQACRTHGQDDYLMGNRQMKWWPVSLSLMVTFYSSLSQIGKPAEVYLYGMQFSLGITGIVICIVLVMFTFLPVLFRLKLTSSYEYLELRFKSKAVRFVSSVSVIISQVFFSALATYAPALALRTVTGFPVWASILGIGAVVTFYTMLGGLKAVIWVDTFQFFIMVAGMVVINVLGVKEAGGLSEVWAINKEHGRLNFFNFDPDPTVRMSFWSVVFGNIFMWLPYYSVNQSCVQRFCSVSTIKEARLALLLAMVSLCFLEVMICFSGLVIFSYFVGCDPLKHPDIEQQLQSSNELLPLFVMKVIHWPGVPGLYIASILSGSFSTVSSCLNALAAVTWEDFFKWKFDYLSERIKTHILKSMVLFYGILATGFAFAVTVFKGTVIQVTITVLDTSASPLVGMFCLGVFFKRSNWLGTIIGCCVGLALSMWISVGSLFAVPRTPPLNTSIAECGVNFTTATNATSIEDSTPVIIEGVNKLYSISYLWFPAIGTFTTILVGLVSSILTAPFIERVKPRDVDESHLAFALDDCSCASKNRSDMKDAKDIEELKDLKA